jgi:hypothetical protein
MLNLFSLSSYVQFLGAFNFANVYSSVQENFFKFFLNVDKIFEESFSGMSVQISSDIDSVNSMSPINTTEGFSTAPAIEEIKRALNQLREEENKTREQTKDIIKKELTMKYSKPMFMAFGLYCTFELIAFGFMDMLGYQSINASFAWYNVFMVAFSAYFTVCESLNTFRFCKISTILRPTHWWVLVISVAAFLLFAANAWIVECIGSKFSFPVETVEWMCYLGILLPVIPFIIAMVFTAVHYRRSVKLIQRKVNLISGKFQKIHNKKTEMDRLYSLFSIGDASYEPEFDLE